jgi:alginate O-acetyltransferase complex protein AlgI
VRFDDPRFLFLFLPLVLAAYFLVLSVASLFPRLTRWTWAASTVVLVAASVYFIVENARAWRDGSIRTLVPVGAAVIVCHAIALAVDVYRREVALRQPLTAFLYLVQFPVLAAGPLIRYGDFAEQHAHRIVGLGAFTYGVRRFVIGVVKVVVVAGTLSVPADKIFALPAARLATDLAWFAALCVSLQIYFQFSGLSDMGVGLGRMFGYKYPDNFRRPYTADSVREFWRRWNVTVITWLRDYLYLPIVGRDSPTARQYLNVVAGFCLLGLWHGGGRTIFVWALYSGFWLALEAIGFGALLARLPAVLRHFYLLAVIVPGWVILRSGTLDVAGLFLKTMAGLTEPATPPPPIRLYLTTQVWFALGLAIIGAGPMVRAISRWRVSLDVAAASLLMMATATAVFIWQGAAIVLSSLRPTRPRS